MKTGSIYAVSTGTYLGEFFVYIGQAKNKRKFLSLPKMINREIENKNVDHALEKGILEFQEVLPVDIINVCKQQFQQNEKTIHRR
jgi:hypothetical protein